MSANSVRPWIRVMVAYRDRGVCQICGKKVEGETSSKRLKRGYKDGALANGGKIIYGEKQPTIDHVIPGDGAGYEDDGYGKVYIWNLTLAHKDCNSRKSEDGDRPSDRQLAAVGKALSKYDIKKMKDKLLEIGYDESSIRSDRSLGRSIFRDFAVYLAKGGKPPKPPAEDDFPF